MRNITTGHRICVLTLAAAGVTGALAVGPAHAANTSTPASAAAGQASSAGVATALIPQTILGTRLPAAGYFIPPRTHGDREFNGHGPAVRVTAQLLLTSRNVRVRVAMVAQETVPDRTTATGTRDYLLYTAPFGRCVTSTNIGPADELQYVDTDHAVDLFAGRDPYSFVRQYAVIGDTAGEDAGVDTGVAVSTKAFTVQTAAC
ncbi:MAG TPA: hypothetical protein VF755_01600 [Catenuloplanes sp.]|jgi:hypothetical protein